MRRAVTGLLVALLLSPWVPAAASSFWLASYNYSDSGPGSTIWKLDTDAGTLTKQADYADAWSQSLADTGDWLYYCNYQGAAYGVSKIDKTNMAIVSSVEVPDIPNLSDWSRFSGLTWDGSDLYALDYSGETAKLTLDGNGDIVGATLGKSLPGDLAMTLLGFLSTDGSAFYAGKPGVSGDLQDA